MTFRDVEEMSLRDLRDITASWRQCPPVHMMVGSYLGAYKPPPKRATKEELMELKSFFGG